MASVAMLSPPIKKEPDVLPRASVFPKRKPGLSTIATRSRFVKARPNINLSSSKTKDSPVNPLENNSTSENVSPEPVESKPETLQRPALPKRTASVNATPRARFQKARPNIGSLLNKSSKDSHLQQEEKTALPPDDGKNVEASTLSVDVSNAVEKDSVSNTDSISNNGPFAEFGSQVFTEDVKSPIKVSETPQICSASTTNNYNVINSDKERSSDAWCTQLLSCKDNESSSVERTSLKEVLEKELPAEESPASDIEDNSSLSSRSTNAVPTSKESPSPTVNKSMEYPTLKSILNSPRKKTATKKAHERRKRIANLSSTPSRSEMTMVDLIYWNPSTSPMKISKPATGPREEDLLPPDENTGPSLPPEEPEEDFNSAPKVIINADGEIILDESSLVVRRKDTIDHSKEAIIENDHTTYSSFRKRSVKSWSKKETAKFYKALSLVGTDFALMESIFQVDGKVTRTRRELKLKFKREEKLHTNYVHTAMYELQTFDVSILDDDSDEMTENSEIVDDAPKRTKKSNDSGIKNPSGRGRKKKSDLPEASVDENHSTIENTPDIIDLEDGVETVDLEDNNEANSHKKAPDSKSKFSRPERARKTKTLTDFVTNLDDLSDTNEIEEESLLPKRKRKVQVLSEESEDNLPETVDKTDKMNESVNNSSEGNVNNIGNIISEDAEITHDKGPSPAKKRRKLQIMPKISQNKEENSQKVTTEVSETIFKTSRSGRKRKVKNMSDFITDPDALSEVDEDNFDLNTENFCEKKKRSGHLEEIVIPEAETEEIEVAVNSISCNESSSVLTAKCINIPLTQEHAKCSTEASTFTTSTGDQLNHSGSLHQVDKDLTIESSNVTNMDNLDNPDVICLPVSPSKESLSTVISSEKASIGNVLNLPDSKACSSISVNNLLTDAVISEVVTSDKRMLRTRKRTVLPNVVKGSKRPGVFQKKQPSVQPSFTNFTPVEEEVQQPVMRTYSKHPEMETLQDVHSSPLHVPIETSANFSIQQSNSEVTRTYSASTPNPSSSTFASTEILTITDENDASQVSSTNVPIHSSVVPEVPQTSTDLSLSVPLIDPNAINLTSEHNSDSSVVILTHSPGNENILHFFMCQKS
ncbi:transcription factor TFIIIB component B [Trichonephila clavata]|uniref:Transcription factor TFIIIB component B n=1 Tax=Trichonephila clavata TaxID=2740835 RepID=A0A8X6HDS2_TRICU|nr:transcription factor TFIIIB component B [Trichonephila clavata]